MSAGKVIPNVPGRCEVGGEMVPEVCELSPLSDGRLSCLEHGLPLMRVRARELGQAVRFANRWVKAEERSR